MSGRVCAAVLALCVVCAHAHAPSGSPYPVPIGNNDTHADFTHTAPKATDKPRHICVEKMFINAEEDEDLTCSGNAQVDGEMSFADGKASDFVNGNGHFIAGLCNTKAADGYIAGRANENMLGDVKCGPVHVIDFEAGRMILEYKETLIDDEKPPCEGGMFLPFIPGEMMWGPEGHAFIYLLMMIFSFLGIAIIADVFMAAIEVITAKTKKMPDGREVKVWNDTIANLTLMALGSSAPEILLSVLETIGMVQAPADPGGLGPGTIVGSAAFNLLVIIAICVLAIGKKEDGTPDTRKIAEIGVFTTTAFYSVFAYVWLFICVSDNQIEMWEAVVTFMLFPVLTIHCYAADQGMLCYGMFKSKDAKGAAPSSEEELAAAVHKTDALKIAMDASKATDEELAKAYGDIPADMAREKMMEDAASLALKQSGAQKPSVMTAKINARRGLTGGKRVLANADTHAAPSGALSNAQSAKPVEEKKEIVTSASGAKISFSSPTYAAEEGKGKVTLHVLRTEDTSGTVHIQYSTSDGTALSGEDFEHARGILTFAPGDVSKDITIKLIDDTEYEPDENFYVGLKEAKGGKKGPGKSDAHSFGDYDIACVTILNDDKPGTFGFEKSSLTVTEDNEYATVKVLRTSGCDGDIDVEYKTIDGTAHAGADFHQTEGSLKFADGETEKVIKVKLIEDDQFEKNETFKIQLSVTAPGALLNPEQNGVAEVTILGDEEAEAFAKEIAQIMKTKMDEMNGTVETATYADQFNEAMNINGEEGEEPGTMDYVMHFLTFGWKVIFATVPPTSWSGGWVTFFVALAYIGVLTAFVADIASIFGCLLTLPDAITAITFVALGTSLPDTFASKSAATQDETADNSVGNVTGSNSVNVFLGLGLPWLIACGANSSYQAPDVVGKEWVMTNGAYVNSKVTIDGKTITFKKGAFPVLAGTMGSSVVLFCACAVACIITIYIRRWTGLGELGGPSFAKNVTAAFFIGLWMVYVVVSSLLEKKHIEPFM